MLTITKSTPRGNATVWAVREVHNQYSNLIVRVYGYADANAINTIGAEYDIVTFDFTEGNSFTDVNFNQQIIDYLTNNPTKHIKNAIDDIIEDMVIARDGWDTAVKG